MPLMRPALTAVLHGRRIKGNHTYIHTYTDTINTRKLHSRNIQPEIHTYVGDNSAVT